MKTKIAIVVSLLLGAVGAYGAVIVAPDHFAYQRMAQYDVDIAALRSEVASLEKIARQCHAEK